MEEPLISITKEPIFNVELSEKHRIKFKIVFLVATFAFTMTMHLFLKIKFSSQERRSPDPDHLFNTAVWTGVCPTKIIYKPNSNGRLGNQMMDYASMYVIGQELPDFVAFIDTGQQKTLRATFKHISVPEIPLLCKSVLQAQVGTDFSSGKSVSRIVYNASLGHADLLKYANTVNLIQFNLYEWLPIFYPKYLHQLKHAFQFHEHIMSEVFRTFDHVRQEHSYSNKPLLFIGIHVRRGDYKHHLKTFYNMTLLAPSFYIKGVDHFHQKYSTNYELIYLIVSNDDAWVRQHLNITNGYSVSRSPQVDMALLSVCNHTITDYGTFGMLPSLFHGGEHYTTNAYEDFIVDMMKQIKTWTVVNLTTPLNTIHGNIHFC